MKKPFHTSVVIGRFQIPHIGHEELLKKAAEVADNIVILIGSVGQPKTTKNPFSFEQRKQLLSELIPEDVKYHILPVRDQRYNNNNWVVDVVNKVKSTLPKGWSDYPPKIALIGHKKDKSSFYLDLFPQWKNIWMEHHFNLSATTIRNNLFKFPSNTVGSEVPVNVKEFLEEWKFTEDFRELQEEYFFLEEYQRPYKDLPFPPVFVTVDAVVIQSGHILMIKRNKAPGKGLWALPGGFLDEGESVREAMLRELVEETQIKLQEIILDRSITDKEVYDHPDRSQRGRTITHAFKIELKPGELPRIKGSSDADKAKWIPLNEVYMMGEEIYEDHLDIILDMVH
jgi:bifunctional NMN adenylyltransferase/nudix hydrolase